MLRSTLIGMVAAILVSAAATAQELQWVYLGEQDTFSGPEDYPFASVCILPSFTVENSGIPNIAEQWWSQTVVPAMNLEEMQYLSRTLHCNILAVPREVLANQPGLLDVPGGREFPLFDMTSELIAADGG